MCVTTVIDKTTNTATSVLHQLSILTGKKHHKIELQRLQKIRIWTFGLLVHQINSLRGSKTETKK